VTLKSRLVLEEQPHILEPVTVLTNCYRSFIHHALLEYQYGVIFRTSVSKAISAFHPSGIGKWVYQLRLGRQRQIWFILL